MKRTILNIAIILTLVLGLNIVTAAPAAAADTINVPGDYATIQEAIDNSSPGDTINVAAGTYDEEITIDRSINLRGAQADVEPRTLVDGIPTGGLRTGAESVFTSTYAITIRASDVTVNGFKFNDFRYGINIQSAPGVTRENVTIQYNILDSDKAWVGILTGEGTTPSSGQPGLFGSILITHNSVDVSASAGGDPYALSGIGFTGASGYFSFVTFEDVEVSHNYITNPDESRGIFCGATNDLFQFNNPLIEKNYIHHCDTGINVGNMYNADVNHNLFEHNTYCDAQIGVIGGSVTDNVFTDNYPSGYDGYPSYSLMFWGTQYGFPVGSANVSVTGNDFYFNNSANADQPDYALRVLDGCDAATITVTQNEFTNGGALPGALAAYNQAPGTLNAPLNWWGDTDPSDNISGPVDYSPWYGAPIGTVPMTWGTNDSINDAIALANPGDTVNVAAGTYNEMIVLNKDGLTLRGANAGIHPVVGVHPTETAGARGPETILSHDGLYAIKPQADGLTVDGFTFTGGNGRLIDTYEDADNFHLTNCIFDSPTQAVSKGVVQFGGGSHTGMLIDFNLFQDEGDHTLYFGGGPYDGLTLAANKFNGYGEGVFWATDTPMVDGVIEYNEFDGTIGGVPGEGGVGLNIGKGGNLAIRNNWFHDMYYTGFQVGIIGGSVTGNTFEDTYPIFSGGWYPSDAFQLWGGEWGTQISSDVTIMNNTIRFNQQSTVDADENGIRLRTGCDAANIHVNMNEFVNGGASATAFAIRNQGTGTLDATLNAWGTTDGPTIEAMLDGDIDYIPFVGDPGQIDSQDFGPGESGTLSVDGTSVDVQMNGSSSGSFGVLEVDGAPGGGYTGMGNGLGIGKSIVILTTAADGSYVAVIQMYYGDVDLVAAGITEDDLRLYYYNVATSTWELAVDGNTTGTPQWMGNLPAPAAIPANLGQYGIDTTAKTIWAVVDHNTDYSGGGGPVEAWVDDDYTPATPGWHLTHFDSIQDAIDSCASGATINVLAGTYNENLVVNKPDMTIKATGNAANTIIQPGADVGIDVQGNGGGFKLKKLTVQSGAGTTFLIQLANGPADVTIVNSVIDTTGDATMGVSVGAAGASGLSITGNTFTGDAGDGLVWGPNVVDVSVTGNTFTGAGLVAYGVQFSGITGASEISGNTFTDIVGSGAIVISNGKGTAGLSITGNEITGCANGIRFVEYAPYAPAGDMDDVDITDNTLTGNGVAIRVGDGAHVLASLFTIEYNYISGSTVYGLQNEHATEIVNAMKNWWGDSAGPNHPTNPLGQPPYGSGDAISDNVVYQPWLDNADQPEDSADYYIDAIADANTEVFIYNAAGGHVVSAGRWSHNPNTAYPDFMVVGGYFIDVVVEDATGFGADTWLEIRFHYEDADVDAGLIEQTFRMKWWDETVPEWKDCSESGVNTAENYVWVIVRATGTSPTLADMYGTPFAASGQRVVIPGLTTWGTLALAVLFLAAVIGTVRRRKRATVKCQD